MTEPIARRICLHVGCGVPLPQSLHPAFHGPEWREIRLDIDPSVKPDIVASIVDMPMVASDSVDAVWSSHNLEHLHAHEVPRALAEFFRVLKPGGTALLAMPDLQKVAELIAADRLEDAAFVSQAGPIAPLDMVYGFGKSIAAGHQAMAHRTGFTPRTLHQALTRAGFLIVQLRSIEFDLWAQAEKPSQPLVSTVEVHR
jgi:SAM-dependent methyltransferase